MKSNPPLHSILICIIIVFVFAASNPAARANTTNWITAGGDWFSATNWDNGIPGTTDDAFINNGGTPEINGFQATARALTLGANVSDSGTLTVDRTYGGFLSVGPCANCNEASVEGSIYVGNGGRGTLNIINGGRVVTNGLGYIALLGDGTENSNGAVTVDGAGSTWTLNGGGRLFVGGNNSPENPGGTALLSVSNGGTVIVNHFAVNGPGLSVGISGTLAGTGKITLNGDSANARRAVINGTLASTETLSITGNLALNPNATTLANVTPQGADRVDVLGAGTAGAAILGGRLIVVLSGTFTPDPTCVTRFTLLHADAGLGDSTFQSVSIQGPKFALFTSQITYDSNNVYLDIVFDHCTPPN